MPVVSRNLLRFVRECARTVVPNARFRRAHPDFSVPPLFLLWDAQSYTNFRSYFSTGAKSAKMYWDLVKAYGSGRSPYRVLEWGCGPARIIRHMPALAKADGLVAEFHGTDYNARSIAWAQQNVPGVNFSLNELAPPLAFADGHFDFVYCRSVFTHLSEAMHFAWIAELKRILRPGGLLSLSTAGLAHSHRMTPRERQAFNRGELVVRGLSAEGKLNYSVFHPHAFVREKLLAGMEIVRHDTPAGTQEMWLARRT